MSVTAPAPPELDERFLEPPGWRWHSFKREGRKIRFGSVFPKDTIPKAVVICLPGLSEFGEKYFETARTCLDMDLAFWVIDWMGQGQSSRYLSNPQKRHSNGFQHDVDDLHYFILEYVKHSCVHPDVGRIPVAMLGHSMGATIGMLYLHQHPEVFECATFTAPLFGIKSLEDMSPAMLHAASGLLSGLRGKSYVKGGGPWNAAAMRPSEGPDVLSSDPVRVNVHAQWFEAEPTLQVGSPTYGWLREAIKACSRILDPGFLNDIKTPCLLALAGKDTLVENSKIRSVAAALENGTLIEFEEAFHEILMEKDEIRDAFFKAFYAHIKEYIIDRPETLKPF